MKLGTIWNVAKVVCVRMMGIGILAGVVLIASVWKAFQDPIAKVASEFVNAPDPLGFSILLGVVFCFGAVHSFWGRGRAEFLMSRPVNPSIPIFTELGSRYMMWVATCGGTFWVISFIERLREGASLPWMDARREIVMALLAGFFVIASGFSPGAHLSPANGIINALVLPAVLIGGLLLWSMNPQIFPLNERVLMIVGLTIVGSIFGGLMMLPAFLRRRGV